MAQNYTSRYYHPIAQTFHVSNDQGVFITRLGLFFTQKSTRFPVSVEIRPTLAGAPDSFIVLPDSVVTKSSGSVNVASNGSAETLFEFDEPIYLAPKTYYAIIVKTYASGADGYNVATAKLGEFLFGSTVTRFTGDLDPGVFFKSSNAVTWTENQEQNLKYKLYRAEFTPTTASAVFVDANTPRRKLAADPFYVDSGSNSIIVSHPNHGFQVSDRVYISGLTAATRYNGILGSSIVGRNLITAVDGSGYSFNADSSSTSKGDFGGSSILATQQYLMDVGQLQIQAAVPPTTTITYSGEFTTSKSFASATETAYASGDLIFIENQKDIYFAQPHVIMNDSNEALNIGGGTSTTITGTMNRASSNNFIAPAIDLQRANLLAINNLIDNPDSAATSGFNVPLQFVAETDRAEGSSLAKHITIPITLAEPAVGIKIIFAANRPDGTNFKVYYRVVEAGADSNIKNKPWIEELIDVPMPTDQNPTKYREYRYTVGGEYIGTIQPFTKYQVKIVMTSVSSSIIPRIKDMRTIALGV
jgi:hypothetical protein